MVQQKNLPKYLLLVFAVIPCLVYLSASFLQYRAAPVYQFMFFPICCTALASVVLLAGIYTGLIYKLWDNVHRIFSSQSTLRQSIIFRLLLLLIVSGVAYLGIRINGSPLFRSIGERNDSTVFVLTSVCYLLNGIVFAAMCVCLKKKRVLIFPLFLLYIVIVTIASSGISYSDHLQYPSYCQNAAPGSIPSIVCNALGPYSAIMVKAGKGAYVNFFGISERLFVPENDPRGNQLDADTIIGVCQHELGHRKHHHTTILNIIGVVASMMPAVGAHIFMECPSVFAAVVGPHADAIPIVAYTVSELLSSILRSYLMPLKLLLSRYFEFQADANIEEKYRMHVLRYIRGAVGDSAITPIYRFLHMRHPSVNDRAARMNLQV